MRSNDIECPYCEEYFDLDHDDCPYYQEDHGVETDCPHCEKKFMVWSSVSWHHSGVKAGCLNGSPHNWKERYPGSNYKHLETCSVCGEERNLKDQVPKEESQS